MIYTEGKITFMMFVLIHLRLSLINQKPFVKIINGINSTVNQKCNRPEIFNFCLLFDYKTLND